MIFFYVFAMMKSMLLKYSKFIYLVILTLFFVFLFPLSQAKAEITSCTLKEIYYSTDSGDKTEKLDDNEFIFIETGKAVCIKDVIYTCNLNQSDMLAGTVFINIEKCYDAGRICNPTDNPVNSANAKCIEKSSVSPSPSPVSSNEDDTGVPVVGGDMKSGGGDATSDDPEERKCICIKAENLDLNVADDNNFVQIIINKQKPKIMKEYGTDGISYGDACQYGVPAINGIYDENAKINPCDPACECIMLSGNDEYFNNFCPATHLTGKELETCKKCLYDDGFWTAVGCIYYGNWRDLIEKNILSKLIGLAGIASLLCIIYAAFVIQTSSGNPEKVKNGKQLITSCLMGLILIIFSVFILKTIGFDVLRLPGFK